MSHSIPSRAAKARRADELLRSGLTSRQIADEMGLAYSYVRDLLSDPSGDGLKRRHERARRSCDGCGGPASWPSSIAKRSSTREVLCMDCIQLVADERTLVCVDLYAAGNSIYDIMEITGMGRGGVQCSLARAGVQMRSRADGVRLAFARRKAAS